MLVCRMKHIKITGSLLLPNSLNNTESEPQFPSPKFELSKAGVRRDGDTIVLALWRSENEDTFCCLFLDVGSAKGLAEQLVQISS